MSIGKTRPIVLAVAVAALAGTCKVGLAEVCVGYDRPAQAEVGDKPVMADEIVVIGGGQVERKGTREEILPSLMGSANVVNFCTGSSAKEGE